MNCCLIARLNRAAVAIVLAIYWLPQTAIPQQDSGVQLNSPRDEIAPLPRGIESEKGRSGPLPSMVAVTTTATTSAPHVGQQTSVDPKSLDKKHADVASELRVAMIQEEAKQAAQTAESENQPDTPPSMPSTDESHVEQLKQIDVIVSQQKAVVAILEDQNAERIRLESDFASLDAKSVGDGPPYSIQLLDQLRDASANDIEKLETLADSLISARDSLETARGTVEQKQRELRQLKEKSLTGSDEIRTAELEVRIAEEMLVLRRQELASEETEEAIETLRANIHRSELKIVEKSVRFMKKTLDEILAEQDMRESELIRQAGSLQSEVQWAERRWLAARQEADQIVSPDAVIIARVDSLKTAQQALQQKLTFVNQRLQRLPMIRAAWKRRFLVVNGNATSEERDTWLEETEEQISQLARELRTRELKQNEVRVTLTGVNTQLESTTDLDPATERWLTSKRDALNDQSQYLAASVVAVENAQRVLFRLQTEIEGKPNAGLGDWLHYTWDAAGKMWEYELTSIDDTSLTVGKVLSSLLMMFFGYFAARILSGLLGKRLPNIGVNEAGAHAIESLSFYLFLIGFGLMALRYSNVPLTVFTFLGGAIAIGVGFGSQNILNNFISGLILLAERPIKVGDLILIEETYGNVTKIGARSTQIRTGENLEIIVPNSKFLENNVVNLTRRDDRLRTSINIGVAYGSDLDKVVALLEQAAAEHPNVDERPKPIVWFNDFGDNALAFQVHFWIHSRTVTQRRKIETEVRLSIDRLFRDGKISIAFPQRDLHLQTAKPLEFRMIDSDGGFRSAG